MSALLGRSRHPKGFPRDPQEHPKGAKERPNTLSGQFPALKRRFFKTQDFLIFKSKFLRLGRSAWEFSICPKRLQERIINDFEEARRRSEKKDIKNDTTRPKEVTAFIDPSCFGVPGSWGGVRGGENT